MARKRVTLKDLAAELGLSVAAVSMALRNHRKIAAATRERVKAKAAELGYRRIGLLHEWRQGWRTGQAWRAAFHIEKPGAGWAPEVALVRVRDAGQQGIDINLGQMIRSAFEVFYLEMQQSLAGRQELPFRIHIPGRWVDSFAPEEGAGVQGGS